MGSNISLPTASQLVSRTNDLQIDTLDISVQDANFWTGIIGVNAVLKEKYSFFAAAGGNLNREFITAGTIPVSLNGVSTSANLDFTNSGLKRMVCADWRGSGSYSGRTVLGQIHHKGCRSEVR